MSRLSHELKTLINGTGKDEHIAWEDVDEATFERFVEYANCKTYTDPEPKPKGMTSPGSDSPKDLRSEATLYAEEISDMQSGPVRLEQEAIEILRAAFAALYETNEPHTIENIPGGDYRDVFLGHARLCHLASRYRVQRLVAIAIRKLHTALVGFVPHEENAH